MIDAREAAAYNGSVRGKLWHPSELPPPYRYDTVVPPDGEAFAHLVSAFQALAGLTIDGKLGTDTLAAMRTRFAALQPPQVGESDDEDGLVIPAVPSAPAFAGRTGVSNCLRIGGRSVPIPESMVAAGISCSNFHDDGEHKFEAWKRSQPCSFFVFHESVSMSQKATIRTLEAKKALSIKKKKNGGKGFPYGVHLICAPDGHFSCHADLLSETLTHANQINRQCIGCEWVNPYNPKWAKPPFDEVIEGPWWCWKPEGAERLYTLPTPQQLVAAVHISRFLPTQLPDLPLAFPTASLGPGRGRIPGWDKGRKPTPGLVAHRDFASHSDGRYILEHVMQHIAEVA